MSVYAAKGDIVTCENGHPVCDFACDVMRGQMQDADNQLCNWRQDKPQVGTIPIPGCAVCGAPFTDGTYFHFEGGWRT